MSKISFCVREAHNLVKTYIYAKTFSPRWISMHSSYCTSCLSFMNRSFGLYVAVSCSVTHTGGLNKIPLSHWLYIILQGYASARRLLYCKIVYCIYMYCICRHFWGQKGSNITESQKIWWQTNFGTIKMVGISESSHQKSY